MYIHDAPSNAALEALQTTYFTMKNNQRNFRNTFKTTKFQIFSKGANIQKSGVYLGVLKKLAIFPIVAPSSQRWRPAFELCKCARAGACADAAQHLVRVPSDCSDK